MRRSDPLRALVVEDAIHGLAAARGARAYAVGLASSLPPEDLEPHADMVVASLSELHDLARLRPRGAAGGGRGDMGADGGVGNGGAAAGRSGDVM